MRRALGLALAVVLATLFVAPLAARATCGAEGCPLVQRGLANDDGRFSFGLRYQDVTQDRLWRGTGEAALADIIADASPHREVELFTHSRSWAAEARVVLTDRIDVVASLPYVQREHRHWLRHTPSFNPLFLNTWKYEGMGDATLLGQFTALRRENGSRLALQGGVKLPTGRRHVPDEAQANFGFASTLEPSARPGTGSTDWLVGTVASLASPWRRMLPVTASVLARFTRRGTDDYRVGNEVQMGLASGWSPVSRVTLLGQVNFAAHGSDTAAEPGEAGHTGIRSLFLTPGMSVQALPGLSVYALYQARVVGHTDEATVVANDHFVVGTSYSLGR